MDGVGYLITPTRKHRMVDVSDSPDFDILASRAYCSIECMCYDGVPLVKRKYELSRIEQRYAYVDERNRL